MFNPLLSLHHKVALVKKYYNTVPFDAFEINCINTKYGNVWVWSNIFKAYITNKISYVELCLLS